MVKLFIGLLFIAMAALLAWWGKNLAREGWKEWRNTPFHVAITSKVQMKYPAGLYIHFHSKYGETLSLINVAIYVEATNQKEIQTRITEYEIRALVEYDEGGETVVTKLPNGEQKIDYKPSGKRVTKWRDLYSVGPLHNRVYLVMKDFAKAQRLDFSKNSFDRFAQQKQLKPGESIIGWIFLEFDSDIASQIPIIKQWEFRMKSSSGDSCTFKIEGPKEGDVHSILSSGAFQFMGGYHDLTKKEYTIIPRHEIRRK